MRRSPGPLHRLHAPARPWREGVEQHAQPGDVRGRVVLQAGQRLLGLAHLRVDGLDPLGRDQEVAQRRARSRSVSSSGDARRQLEREREVAAIAIGQQRLAQLDPDPGRREPARRACTPSRCAPCGRSPRTSRAGRARSHRFHAGVGPAERTRGGSVGRVGRKRAESIGCSSSAAKIETTSEIVTVSAWSRKNSPAMPGHVDHREEDGDGRERGGEHRHRHLARRARADRATPRLVSAPARRDARASGAAPPGPAPPAACAAHAGRANAG